jgi:hypothetical protein
MTFLIDTEHLNETMGEVPAPGRLRQEEYEASLGYTDPVSK